MTEQVVNVDCDSLWVENQGEFPKNQVRRHHATPEADFLWQSILHADPLPETSENLNKLLAELFRVLPAPLQI